MIQVSVKLCHVCARVLTRHFILPSGRGGVWWVLLLCVVSLFHTVLPVAAVEWKCLR